LSQDLQQNRYDQLLRRVGGLIGPGSKVSEVLGELFPVIGVEQLPLELLFLSGTKLGQGASLQNAVAANNNHSQIFNPAGSGQLLVPTLIHISTNSIQTIEYATTETALATDVGNVIPRDTRVGVVAPVSGQIRTVTQAGGLPSFALLRVQADITFTLHDETGLFVLAPGTGLTFATSTVNTVLRMNYLWRERPALQSELNF